MRVSLGLGAAVCLILATISVTPAADDVDASGKWSGTWTSGNFGGPCRLELVQKGQDLTGEVQIDNRPVLPTNISALVKGSVKGDSIKFSYTPYVTGRRPSTVFAEGKVSQDGRLTATFGGGPGGTGVHGSFALKRPQ